jgi:hypothetical protein
MRVCTDIGSRTLKSMMQMAAGFPVANTKLLTALCTELCVLCPEGSVAIKTPINSLKPSGNYMNHLL